MRDLAGGAAVHRRSQWLAAAMDACVSCVVLYVLGRYRSPSRAWTPRSALAVVSLAVRASVAVGGMGPRMWDPRSVTHDTRLSRDDRTTSMLLTCCHSLLMPEETRSARRWGTK